MHSIFESWTRPLRQLPSAMTIGFWRLGALEKSHPNSNTSDYLKTREDRATPQFARKMNL